MRPRFLGTLVLLLCSTLVSLLVAEIAVRVTWGTPMPEKLPLAGIPPTLSRLRDSHSGGAVLG